jgi:biopolymer transport protein ExbD
MRRKQTGLPAPKTDVVPMINVALVVVLTLMMISPFLNQPDADVDLPDAAATETEDQDKVEVIFTRDRGLAVGDRAVTMAELEPTLAAIFAVQPSSMAVIKADEGIAYGEIEQLLAAIQRAGAPRIALATEPKKGLVSP